MISDRITCDVCSATKGETNHWLVAIQDGGYSGMMFVPAEDVSERRALASTYEDICGHACAVKRFSQWLETLTTPQKGTPE